MSKLLIFNNSNQIGNLLTCLQGSLKTMNFECNLNQKKGGKNEKFNRKKFKSNYATGHQQK